MTSPAAISVHNLTVDLGGHRVIDDISFDVETGSTTAILGPNGAGKSVLLRALLRLVPKTSGEVLLFGTDHKHYRQVASDISYIPQRLAFDEQFPLTVEGLFSLKSPRAIGMTKKEKERMREVLEFVGMKDSQDKRISQLSGGQFQRILMAYSLLDHPRLLILDEPSAGIDTKGQETIYTLLSKIQKEESLTILLVSHEMEVVMQYATQVLCLNKDLLCAGVPSQVLTDSVLKEMYSEHAGRYEHNHE